MAASDTRMGGGGVPTPGYKGDSEMAEVAEATMDQEQATASLRAVRNGVLDAGLKVYGPHPSVENARTKPWPTEAFDQILGAKRTTS